MTKAIYVLCSVSFSCTDVCVTDLGKAAKGTEAVDPGAIHGMNVFTHNFKGCMAKYQIPYPLMKFKVPKIVKC